MPCSNKDQDIPLDPLERFLDQTKNRPDHVAVVEGSGDSVTYSDLGELVRRIAFSLSTIHPHPRVLIHLEQSAACYASMFGTLYAGGYYAPTNISAPAERQRLIYDRFAPNVVVSDQKNLESLGPLDLDDVTVININNLPEGKCDKPLESHDLAYVMFTSGSTGIPKGVMIPRSALSHYVQWAIEEMGITHEDRLSQHPNVAFDLSVLDIYGGLCGGATLFPLAQRKDQMLPAQFIKQNELTIWNSVPSVISLMDQANQITSENFASLRLLTFCGEPLLGLHLKKIFSALPNATVHNTYGPTEATVSCTLLKLNSGNWEAATGSSVALGSAIPGMGIHLIRPNGLDEGEIVITGPQLARGYWLDDDITANKFVNMKINGKKQRAYCTGDLGFQKGEHLYFLGRNDRQIKLHGHRIELGDIDAAICSQGFSNACTVFVNNILHSFVESVEPLNEARVREVLLKTLPLYQVPKFIHQAHHLPRNSNDKIDVKLLMEMLKNE